MPKQVRFTLKIRQPPEDLAAGVAVRSLKQKQKLQHSRAIMCATYIM